MSQDLTTRDVFQQVDNRLTRVEQDLRAFRDEVNARFERISADAQAFRSEVNARLARLEQRFDQLQWRLIGLFVVTWVTVFGSIWLKP